MFKLQILDKFIFKRFFSTFLGTTLLFTTIGFIVRIFETLNKHINNPGEIQHFILFYLFSIPQLMTFVIPPAFVFSIFFIISDLKNKNELYVILTSGQSFLRIIKWLFLFAIFMVLFFFMFNEFIAYPSTYKSYSHLNKYRDKPIHYNRSKNISELFVNINSKYFYLGKYNPVSQKGKAMHLIEFDSYSKAFKKIIQAKEFYIKKNAWELKQGYIVSFNGDGNLNDKEEFHVKTVNFSEKPEIFQRVNDHFEEKNFQDLNKDIFLLNMRGVQAYPHKIELHSRFSFPMVIILLFIIGVLLAYHLKKGTLILSFVLSLVLSMIYFFTMFFVQSLGRSGALHYLVAAWFPNILFGMICLYLLYYYRKI